MDAISADALSPRGLVLDQEGHIAGKRQLAQPEIQGGVGLGRILAKQDTGHVRSLDDFGQGSFDHRRTCRRKREVEPTGRRRFSHFAASTCLSLRNGAVLSVSVSNHAGRGAVNFRPAPTRRSTAGVRVGSNWLLTIGATFTTLSHGRPVEGAKVATPSQGRRGRRGEGT